MKKTALAILCAAIAATSNAAALTKKQADYFKNRRICVKRDTMTMPGYVITHWHRNGKPDTKGPAVVTNRLQKIVGAEQKNPIQERAEAEAKPLRDLKKAAKRTAKNFDKIMKDLEKAKKKAEDADELAFYERLGEIITEAFKAEGAK